MTASFDAENVEAEHVEAELGVLYMISLNAN